MIKIIKDLKIIKIQLAQFKIIKNPLC